MVLGRVDIELCTEPKWTVTDDSSLQFIWGDGNAVLCNVSAGD